MASEYKPVNIGDDFLHNECVVCETIYGVDPPDYCPVCKEKELEKLKEWNKLADGNKEIN